MGRSPCCSKEGLNRGAWTVVEDKILTDYIKLHGEGRWRSLPKKAGLKRCGKSCRLRWLNYLRPDIKRGNISHDEEDLILRLHRLLGNRWSLIAGRLPGRTDNEIKNYWNTNLGKKCADPNRNKSKSKSKPPPPPPPATNGPRCIDSSTVIRTKATRCSKVFMTITPPTTTTAKGNSAGALPEPAAPSSTTLTHLAETDDFSMDLMAEYFSLEVGDQLWLPDLLNSSNWNGDERELTCGCSDAGSLEEYWSNLSLSCLQHPSSSSSSSSPHTININSFPPLPLDHLLTPN